jgi:hypothetical protein
MDYGIRARKVMEKIVTPRSKKYPQWLIEGIGYITTFWLAKDVLVFLSCLKTMNDILFAFYQISFYMTQFFNGDLTYPSFCCKGYYISRILDTSLDITIMEIT